MSHSDANPSPVIEPAVGKNTSLELTERSLAQRVRQQEILAELGVFALQGGPFLELLNTAVRLTAEGLGAEFCKVLEHLPAENRFVVRAGVGWDEGVVGSATVGADLESPAGFALHTGKPVISNHLREEQRFRTPDLFVQHGIRRAMNVILQGDGSPFGVLEVDSHSDGEFGERDITFLQGAANVLGMAIERERKERQLKAALATQKMLLKEINHRAKNSLQLVTSMLQLQASDAGDPRLSEHLIVASNRISAVGRLYDRLSHEADIDRIDLGFYLRDVCNDLAETEPRCNLHIEAPQGIQFSPERAIHLALILNELVTNACKYSCTDDSDFHVWVCLKREEQMVSISIRDDGVGLPANFDLAKSTGLGMRIVTSLSSQLQATLTLNKRTPGTEFTLLIPLA
jgi:two-component sensor histidine kinase